MRTDIQSDKRRRKRKVDFLNEFLSFFSAILRRNAKKNFDKFLDKCRSLKNWPNIQNDSFVTPIPVRTDSVRIDKCVSDCSNRIFLRKTKRSKVVFSSKFLPKAGGKTSIWFCWMWSSFNWVNLINCGEIWRIRLWRKTSWKEKEKKRQIFRYGSLIRWRGQNVVKRRTFFFFSFLNGERNVIDDGKTIFQLQTRNFRSVFLEHSQTNTTTK